MIRIRFFRARGIKSETYFGRTVVQFHVQTPSVVEYSNDEQIDVFDTQPLAENQVDEACEYAHTPAISAAIAAPTFRGIAILLIVTHLSLLLRSPHHIHFCHCL